MTETTTAAAVMDLARADGTRMDAMQRMLSLVGDEPGSDALGEHIPALFEMLGEGDSTVTRAVLVTLSLMTKIGRKREHREAIGAPGARVLARLLVGGGATACAAVDVLVNVCKDVAAARDAVREAGGVAALVPMLGVPDTHALLLMRNLCTGNVPNCHAAVAAGALPFWRVALDADDAEEVQHATVLLCVACEYGAVDGIGASEGHRGYYAAEVVPAMAAQLLDRGLAAYALRALLAASRDARGADAVAAADVVPACMALLQEGELDVVTLAANLLRRLGELGAPLDDVEPEPLMPLAADADPDVATHVLAAMLAALEQHPEATTPRVCGHGGLRLLARALARPSRRIARGAARLLAAACEAEPALYPLCDRAGACAALLAHEDLGEARGLLATLRAQAVARVDAALETGRPAALRAALEAARAVRADPAPRVHAALAAAEAKEAETREALARVGLGAEEVTCPITCEAIADPVVASDGHTYERDAIAYVVHCGDGRSPMTREELRGDVYPNVALRRGIVVVGVRDS